MKALLLICSSLLVVATFDLPIGYYTFLRIVVTIGAVTIIYQEFDEELNPWIIVFGIIAIVFNPIIPIYLHDKGIWTIIDLTAALLFGVKAFNLSKDTADA